MDEKQLQEPPPSDLLYPGDEGFDYYLATLPPNWRQCTHQYHGQVAFVAEPGSGLLRPANTNELVEYVEGGEYDERLAELDGLEQFG